MLKVLGSILILGAGVGIAFCLRRELDGHLEMLYAIRRLFVELEQEMRSSLLPMEEILREAGDVSELRTICEDIAEALSEKGAESGAGIWNSSFWEKGNLLGITREELTIVAEAGSAFFGKRVEDNRRRLALYLERLDFQIEIVRREQKEKRKVYQTVSIFGGMMLVILLL